MLDAFGASEPSVLLPGGERRTYAAGSLVLKPVADPQSAAWCAELCRDIEGEGFRVPPPVATRSGEWTVDGWAAWQWVEGEHAEGRWRAVFDVARAFHRALEGVSRPDFLDRRSDPWWVGAQVAWGEREPDVAEAVAELIAPLLDRLLAARRPVELTSQVIHSDIGGNVLFAEGLPPAVIDFSPMYRPAGFSLAIAAFDAIGWGNADRSVLSLLADVEQLDQLLVRAAIFRLIAAAELFRDAPGTLADGIEAYERTVELILDRLA